MAAARPADVATVTSGLRQARAQRARRLPAPARPGARRLDGHRAGDAVDRRRPRGAHHRGRCSSASAPTTTSAAAARSSSPDGSTVADRGALRRRPRDGDRRDELGLRARLPRRGRAVRDLRRAAPGDPAPGGGTGGGLRRGLRLRRRRAATRPAPRWGRRRRPDRSPFGAARGRHLRRVRLPRRRAPWTGERLVHCAERVRPDPGRAALAATRGWPAPMTPVPAAARGSPGSRPADRPRHGWCR